MANDKKQSKVEEEEDLDEDEELDDEELDEDDEYEDEEDDEDEAPVVPPRAAHPGGHAQKSADPDSLDQEPGWWIPHVILGTLVVIGVLGFFGFFNPIFDKFGKKNDVEHKTTGSASHESPAPASKEKDAERPKNEKPAPTAEATAKPSVDPDPTFGAKRILVSFKDAKDSKAERSKTDAKTRAEEALTKLKGGAKFEDIAGEYSDEPGAKTTGGNLGNFKRRVYDPSLESAVERTKVGELSEVFESPFGYEIVQRTK